MKKLFVLLVLGAAASQWCATVYAAPKTGLTKAPLQWPTIPADSFYDSEDFTPSVAALQYLLRGRGFYHAKVDGLWGLQTSRAVKAFQKSKKLRADGVAGRQTLPLLVVNLKRGAKGDAVRAAQILARAITTETVEAPNLGLETDGNFGPATESAVRTAQKLLNSTQQRLAVDGIMGPRSWCLLIGGKVKGQDPKIEWNSR